MQRLLNETPKEQRRPVPFEGLTRQFLRPGFQNIVFFLFLAFIGGAFIVSIIATVPYSADDAFIPLRYAENFAHHGQLNWNLDDPERVEGYSSSLYLALAILAIKLSLSPILVLKLISIASLFGSFFLVYNLTRSFSNRWFGLLAASFYAGYYGTIWWGISGLETGFYVMISLLCFKIYMLSLKAAPHQAYKLIACLSMLTFIAGITRPEGPIIGIVVATAFIINSLIRRKPFKELARGLTYLAVPFTLFYGIFFAARYSYFHKVWPNTYYYKTAYQGDVLVLIKMFISVAGFILVFGFLGIIDPKKRVFLLPAYIYIGVLLVLLRGVDPIMAIDNRHASVAIALAAVIFALSLHEASRLKPLPAICLTIYLAIGQAYISITSIKGLRSDANMHHERMAALFQIAEWLNEHSIKEYALGDAGIVPYRTPKSHVYDYYGLNSKQMTAASLVDEKETYVQWLAGRRPEAIIVVSRYEHTFKPRNAIQELLAAEFSEENGYHDIGLSFGGPHDLYFYRILARKE